MKRRYIFIILASTILVFMTLISRNILYNISVYNRDRLGSMIVDYNYSLIVNLQSRLFRYLSKEGNRQEVLKKALKLNHGQYINACVYFSAEALRQNGIDIPKTTCNTTGLIAQLKQKGWRRSSNYKDLKPGDICFSRDQNHGNGAPAHTYIFMAWVSPGNYDYAMVCDNQVDRYGTVYHKRNIANIDVYKGEVKEAFQFFMRPKGLLCYISLKESKGPEPSYKVGSLVPILLIKSSTNLRKYQEILSKAHLIFAHLLEL